jgi:hypothetical protein
VARPRSTETQDFDIVLQGQVTTDTSKVLKKEKMDGSMIAKVREMVAESLHVYNFDLKGDCRFEDFNNRTCNSAFIPIERTRPLTQRMKKEKERKIFPLMCALHYVTYNP